MKTVTVKAPSKTYNVHVGSGLLGTAGALARKAGVCGRAVIITDGKVDALYGQRLEQALNEADIPSARFVFDAGEASKTPETLVRALEFTAQSGLTRTDTIFALGGGVAGDLAGLCAALYMRGIKLVQVPTTVLAAVDSSVGGKTAVDLKAGKNLAGAFYQPDFVVCDTDTFETLPDCEMANGWAEIIKYGTICDAALMDEAISGTALTEETIARCIEIKSEIVASDERDAGARQLLNFGHTFGHAIESASGYRLPHGAAVACGMTLMAAACAAQKICPPQCPDIIKKALRVRGLPCSAEYGAEQLYNALLMDKKRAADDITLIVLRDIGCCARMNMPLSQAKEMLAIGIKEAGRCR